jgi:hypothetical protein
MFVDVKSKLIESSTRSKSLVQNDGSVILMLKLDGLSICTCRPGCLPRPRIHVFGAQSEACSKTKG